MSKKQITVDKILASPDEMLDVIQRAQGGDKTAMPALQDMLDRMPQVREIMGADLERTVELSLSKSLAGKVDLAFQEAIKRKLAALREELEGPSPSSTERLLVDRIAACWFQVQEADLRYTQAGNCSFEQADFHMRRQDRASRRFLLAVKTLATVRKLGLPALQINIGDNQTNVASAAVMDAG